MVDFSARVGGGDSGGGETRAGRNRRSRSGGWVAAACALLGASALMLSLLEGIPRSYDLPDHLGTTRQFLQGLLSGDFYPRWAAEFNAGWGEPTLVFYPPGLYYAAALGVWLAGGDMLTGFFLSLAGLSILGGLGAFFLTRRLFGAWAGAGACLAFALVPYRVFEIYCSGLYSAFAAGCLTPWVLLAVFEIASAPADSRSRRTAVLAWPILFAGVVLFNLPTAVFLSYLLALWLIFEVAVLRQTRRLKDVVLGGAWGAALSGVYLIPAALERRFIHVPYAEGTALYGSNFLFQARGSWMGSGLKSVFGRMGAFPAIFFLISLGVLVAAVRSGLAGRDPRTGTGLRLLGVLGLGSLMLTTPLSSLLWHRLPYLKDINLPWRFLEPLGLAAVVSAAGAVGVLLARWRSWPRSFPVLVLLLFVPLAAVSLAFDRALSLVNGRIPAAQGRAAIPTFAAKEAYFLPKGALPLKELPNLPLAWCEPPCRAEPVEWAPSRRQVRVSSPSAGRLLIRTYFFPGWEAELLPGGSRLAVWADAATGALTVTVPSGESRVLLRFRAIPDRTAGAAVSILAAGAWVAAAVASWRRSAKP